MEPIYVDLEDLPCDKDCSFVPNPQDLPSPDAVRTRAAENNPGGNVGTHRPAPVFFPDVGVLVKWGSDISIAEGQCLWFLRRHLHPQVPVPEIYGWRSDGDQVFLYMEIVNGVPLPERWPTLDRPDCVAICEQLSNAIRSWRRIRQADTQTTPLNHIGGQALREIMFQDAGAYPAGPFRDVRSFHAAFAKLAAKNSSSEDPRPDYPEMAGLTDEVEVVFTHNDLDQSNILVSRSEEGTPVRIVGIIDWHQSGWYPEPWEALKAQSVAAMYSTWQEDYLPMIFAPPKYEYYYAWEYISLTAI